MKNILIVFFLIFPIPAFASDMAGVGLAVIVIDVFFIIMVAFFISVFFKSKRALYSLYAIDALVIFQSLLVFSYDWKLEGDIYMRNIHIIQLLCLFILTFVFFRRVKKVPRSPSGGTGSDNRS